MNPLVDEEEEEDRLGGSGVRWSLLAAASPVQSYLPELGGAVGGSTASGFSARVAYSHSESVGNDI